MSDLKSTRRSVVWLLVIILMLFAHLIVNQGRVRDLQRRVGQLEQQVK